MFAASKTASVSGGYQISRSLRFNSADTAYLGRTLASASNQQKWTWSGWVKRTGLGSVTLFGGGTSGSAYTELYYSNDTLFFYNNLNSTATVGTAGVYRDVSAWYHVVCAVDTTQATASNRIKLYVNGSQPTLTTTTYPAQNTNMHINSASVHSIGVLNYTAGFLEYFNGQMTEINFIDGQQLDPSSFGETNAQTGVWQPKAYSGSYGTNGFYLNFSDNSNTTAATLGKDYSGNGNNWTPNNFSVTAGAGNDSLVDSPTSYGTDTGAGGTVRGNYATFNPIGSDMSFGSLSNGNLSASTNVKQKRGTMSFDSGKWYWEVVCESGGVPAVGVADISKPVTNSLFSATDGAVIYYGTNGNKYVNGSGSAYGATWSTADVLGVALDKDNNTVTFYKNNASQGSINLPTTTASYTLVVLSGTSDATSTVFTLNAGQRPFAYTAPSGFKALCTQNLPTPTIGATTATQASQFFAPVLYTGSGSTQTISTGFDTNFVWVKCRNSAQGHLLTDIVRGSTKILGSDNTSAEVTNANYPTFVSGGFSVSGNSSEINNTSNTYVAWNWKANGSGSTNTAGSITSTVSANTTSGFSVVTWTASGGNATVGHGLGVAPAMLIYKARGTTGSWVVLNKSLPNMTTNWLKLNTSDATLVGPFSLGGAPTSSVFYADSNFGSSTMVTYCFAEVAGYSAFGSYTGNGSADGPFIYTGFRPAFVLIKNTTSGAGPSWQVRDSARIGYNSANYILYPNLSNAEYSSAGNFEIDFLSNGFKIRTSTDAGCNGSGDTMIYACFASAPFKYSLAR